MDAFRVEADPAAARVHELLADAGIATGDAWDVQEHYGYQEGVHLRGHPAQIILFYSGGDRLLLSLDTEAAESSERLLRALAAMCEVLERSGQFELGEPLPSDRAPWKIPSMEMRDDGWKMKTRAWGQAAHLRILDPELVTPRDTDPVT